MSTHTNRTRTWRRWGISLFLLICGGALLLMLTINTTEQLEHWHTAHLTEEFQDDSDNTIESFAQYMQLEERLFQQLEGVYDDTPADPEFRLSRYTRGGVADPARHTPNWNRSFELQSDEPVGGILLLHGMSDSPYSLRALGATLHEHGYWVIGLRLPGHGTIPAGLHRITWEDMAGAVKLAIDHLSATLGSKPIHIIGYSTGAPLALHHTLDALEGSGSMLPASLVLISPAIGIHPLAGVAGLRNRLSAIPGLSRIGWLSILPEFDPYKYNSFTTNAGNQVHRITRVVSQRLNKWLQRNSPGSFPPVLVLKSTVDATVSTDAVVDRLLTPLQSQRHELILFDINRAVSGSLVHIANSSLFTERLVNDASLPFVLTLVTNKDDESLQVVAYRRSPDSHSAAAAEQLGLAWPDGVISLSHVALPFPPDDPLYGAEPPADPNSHFFLGHIPIKGERGLLRIPYDWLIRLRHNPFYDYLETRVVDWVQTTPLSEAK